MNSRKLKRLVDTVQEPDFWDFGNDVLYQLCLNHPGHSDKSVAAAKIWLIGRSYAAAIERRKIAVPDRGHFYRDRVAPEMVRSEIDKYLTSLAAFRIVSTESFSRVIETHKYVTDLFGRITGQDKRSLASKYLHFHLPNLFFIYDSRAAKGVRMLSDIVGRASRNPGVGDRRRWRTRCH
jgi:hypothetical protein